MIEFSAYFQGGQQVNKPMQTAEKNALGDLQKIKYSVEETSFA